MASDFNHGSRAPQIRRPSLLDIWGAWSFHYDTLNPLANGSATLGQDDNRFPNYCWQYDSFGNRTGQTTAAASGSASGQFAATAGGANACAVNGQAGPSFAASYNANNRMASTTQNPNQGSSYDAAGDITYDGLNSYLYDGEGRICAVRQQVAGLTVMTGYIYNADGARVAKGSLTQFTCDTNPADTSTYNGFTPTSAYVLGPGGEQLTELTNTAGSGQSPAWQWLHTNVEAGALSATYDTDLSGQTAGKLYFHLSDWLGTRRRQTDYAGNPVLNFTGLPFGDGLSSIPVSSTDTADATEHDFTGKERDAESGNDYFGARYYASNMGRFMSPDWSSNPVSIPFGNVLNPQTFNLYSYVGNNPLNGFDPYGHLKCPDGKVQDVACAIQTAWNWFKGLFGGGSGGGNGCTGTCAAPNPNDSLPRGYSTSRIVWYREYFRAPDYYNFSAQLGIANPSVQYVPATKNWYMTSAVAFPSSMGVTGTAGWSWSHRPEDYLDAKGFAGCGSFIVAGCVGYSPGGGGWAREIGLGTPGYSFSGG